MIIREWLRTLFAPRQNIFYDLMLQQSQYMIEATGMVLAYLEKPDHQKRKEARALEHDADEVRRRLVLELNRTFVTPMDREDIHALSRNLDDVVDYAYTTTEELDVFALEPNEWLKELASMVHEGARELHTAMQSIQSNPQKAIDHAQRAKKIETRVEEVYRRALAELFVAPQDIEGVMTILKLREVYRHLSNAADRVDEAANILSDTMVKMA